MLAEDPPQNFIDIVRDSDLLKVGSRAKRPYVWGGSAVIPTSSILSPNLFEPLRNRLAPIGTGLLGLGSLEVDGSELHEFSVAHQRFVRAVLRSSGIPVRDTAMSGFLNGSSRRLQASFHRHHPSEHETKDHLPRDWEPLPERVDRIDSTFSIGAPGTVVEKGKDNVIVHSAPGDTVLFNEHTQHKSPNSQTYRVFGVGKVTLWPN